MTHRSDYPGFLLLALGTAFGLALGPWGLGWVAPVFYQRHFVGGTQAQEALELFDRQTQQRRARLAGTGVTDAALEQFDRDLQADPQRALLEARVKIARQEHADRFLGWATAIVIALAVMMAGEALVGRPGIQKNLATARYALMAVWLAVVSAIPGLLHQVQVVFVVLLVAVSLAAALVPLRSAPTSGHGV